MKIKEFTNLSEEDLVAREKQLKKDLFEMESHRQMGRVEKPASFRNLRRDIARILTVINERRISKDNSKDQAKVKGKS
jgi:large subunit ribosomal protein L29